MKYKKTILLLALFIITFIYIFHPLIEKNMVRDGFKEKVIRFHIRANSDKKEDQALKLKIRDEILKVMKERFKDTKSILESRTVIQKNMPEMKEIAENIIKDEGKDYSVNISLKEDNFPLRKYGNMIFPQGKYEALIIEIGQAQGENWWCVMFPPICFVDITHSVAYASENSELGNHIKETNPPLILKSKIVDYFIKKKDNGQFRDNGQLTIDNGQLKSNDKDKEQLKEKIEPIKQDVGIDALVVPGNKNIILMDY